MFNQDYMRTARSKGMSEWRVAIRHVLPNTLAPLIVLLARRHWKPLLAVTAVLQVSVYLLQYAIVLDVRDFHRAEGKIDPRTDFERYMANGADHWFHRRHARQLDAQSAQTVRETLGHETPVGTPALGLEGEQQGLGEPAPQPVFHRLRADVVQGVHRNGHRRPPEARGVQPCGPTPRSPDLTNAATLARRRTGADDRRKREGHESVATRRRSRSSPMSSSRRISSPTTKKKSAIRPSFTQCRNDIVTPKASVPTVSAVCQKAS